MQLKALTHSRMNRILNQPSGLSALSEGLELKVPDRNWVKAHDINGA